MGSTDMSKVSGLMTYDEVMAERHKNGTAGAPPKVAKGESRRELKAEKVKSEAADERRWKKEVRKRDGDKCRWCGRKVEDCIERLPERREVHHVSGRVVVAIRWDRRNALTLCGACHDRVTGKVNERFLIHSKHTFTVDGVKYINADKPVRYERVA